MAKPALGRGLGALLGGSPIAKPSLQPSALTAAPVSAPAVENGERVQRVALDRVHPCPFQPRKEFSAEALRELADSIREQGIVQPLIVRETPQGFELIAGERRWRAAQLIGLTDVPVIVREADDRAVLELALIENLQRENLNAMEEAQGYAQLVQQFQLKQDEVAAKVGKSRASVTNALRLLKLPEPVQEQLREGRLTVGHAKVILGLESGKQQQLAANRILHEGLNVRQTEELVARLQTREDGAIPRSSVQLPARDAHLTDLENRLRERLGTRIRLKYTQGKGALEIAFFSDAELQRVLDILGVKMD
jgi:ParB family chromosome partitioning protein